MKIALVAPLLKPVPPVKYGGVERIVEVLTRFLSAQNHTVTLYASGQSQMSEKNVTVVECSPWPTADKMEQNRRWEINEFLRLIADQDNFDIIHIHIEPYIWKTSIDNVEINLFDYLHRPTIVTFHNSTHIQQRIDYYALHQNLYRFAYVFISDNQRQPLNFFPNSQVIYNGIVVDDFEFTDKPEDYLLFLGRISAIKGIEEAISSSRKTDKKLVVAAIVNNSDQEYYGKTINPLIDGQRIKYAGELSFAQKVKYLTYARCLLFPIKWEEPFGLVMIEAMACGTPVIAYARGSVPEIIVDGITGYIVNPTYDDIRGDYIIKKTGNVGICDAIEKLYALPAEEYRQMREQCRERVKRYFTVQQMTKKYIEAYTKTVSLWEKNQSEYKISKYV